MENQVQATDDKQAEVGNEKKPYQTPTLTKLGSVEQVTGGSGSFLGSDVQGLSV